VPQYHRFGYGGIHSAIRPDDGREQSAEIDERRQENEQVKPPVTANRRIVHKVTFPKIIGVQGIGNGNVTPTRKLNIHLIFPNFNSKSIQGVDDWQGDGIARSLEAAYQEFSTT